MSAREVTAEGFAPTKTTLRYQNGKDWLRHQRSEWAAVLNDVARRYGLGLMFDHRSREARGLEGAPASLPLNTLKAAEQGRAPLNAQGVVTYYRTLERRVRATGLKGDQLRAYQSRIGQAQRETLRCLQYGQGRAIAALHLKNRTTALREKREALEAVREERERLREQQGWMKMIADQLNAHSPLEQSALARWAKGLDQGLLLAAERIERARLQRQADLLRLERQGAAETMAREQAQKAQELERIGRPHEAAAVRENAAMFRRGPTLKGSEPEKRAMGDIAQSRIARARELDRQCRPRNDDA